jgi:tRNA nucleotidyltransferase (CCA-adding enzyme)
VEGDAPALAAALAEKTGARLTAHPRFGTATVELDGAQLDLVTARREEYPHPGALPVVGAGSMADDLARRDFSINAMAFPISRSESGLLDPHGGLADLADGLVRVLHPASFVDDPTRVFRAVRYARRLGFTVEPGTLERLNEAVFAGALATVSGDRLRRELERIFAEDRPAEALEAAAELGVLSAIHPALGRREVTGAIRKAGALPAVPPSFWLAALSYHLTPGEGESLVQRLNLTKEQSRLVRDTIWLRENEDAVRGAAATPSRLAAALGGIHLEAVAAAAPLTGDPVVSGALTAHNTRLQGDRAGISGDDLLAMGLARSPAVGAVLGQLRDARLDGLVTTPEEERILARKLVSLVADRGLPPHAERTGE